MPTEGAPARKPSLWRAFAQPAAGTLCLLGFASGLPFLLVSYTLSFWLKIETAEIDPVAYDTLTVSIRDTSNKVLSSLATYSNVNAGGYVQKTFDVSKYKGQKIRVHFKGVEDLFLLSNFFIDDTALTITK